MCFDYRDGNAQTINNFCLVLNKLCAAHAVISKVISNFRSAAKPVPNQSEFVKQHKYCVGNISQPLRAQSNAL